jgi:hypothetical protein
MFRVSNCLPKREVPPSTVPAVTTVAHWFTVHRLALLLFPNFFFFFFHSKVNKNQNIVQKSIEAWAKKKDIPFRP